MGDTPHCLISLPFFHCRMLLPQEEGEGGGGHTATADSFDRMNGIFDLPHAYIKPNIPHPCVKLTYFWYVGLSFPSNPTFLVHFALVFTSSSLSFPPLLTEQATANNKDARKSVTLNAWRTCTVFS